MAQPSSSPVCYQSPSHTPQRQIRASFSTTHITVYQAYSPSIANAAVQQQKLNASPDFRMDRMTWVKPSWCWMMYRSGYALKDARQNRILALKMKHAHFLQLLSLAAVTHNSLSPDDRLKPVRVQWDPERGPALERLNYRSIQIGIGQKLVQKWVEEWIDEIEDVTQRALSLKKFVDEEREMFADGGNKVEQGEPTNVEVCVAKGLIPAERVYEVPEEVRRVLRMEL